MLSQREKEGKVVKGERSWRERERERERERAGEEEKYTVCARD